ncbi:uncharacterized protein METZ01_LOCUS149232, partial [marine metagenome]
LVSYDVSGVVVEVVLKEGASFLIEDYVPAWVGIEYAAQAVAAWAGLQAIQDDKEAKIGLLLSCRRYKSIRPRFILGEVLKVHAIEDFSDGQMGAYSCSIYDEAGMEVVMVSLNTFMPENVKEIKGMAV